MLRWVLSTLLVAACAGCGQLGPLHLPGDAPAQERYLLVRKPASATPQAAPVQNAPAAHP